MCRSTPVFDALQTYLGSSYVNDFNFLGRVYQVTAQAEPSFGIRVANIRQLYTRNNSGGMVPLGTLFSAREIAGPDKVMHYNLYPSADISGTTVGGLSSGQAIQIMEPGLPRTRYRRNSGLNGRSCRFSRS